MATISDFIHGLPKCDLHVHIEGTLEPEMKFALAGRNNLALPYADAAAMRAAYRFDDLPSFLKVYYEGMAVLLKEQDFYELTYAYLRKARSQNVLYAEIFFDPEAHAAARWREGARHPDAADPLLPARLERRVRHDDAAAIAAL